jgi:two-component system LytT family sensor kinase
MNEGGLISQGRRDHYAIRATDVFAVVGFWILMALISTAGRELDPRVPGLPERVTTAVVNATYVEYALWAVLTLPILWLTSRYSIERGQRAGRVLLLAALGVVIAMLMDGIMAEVRQWFLEVGMRPRRRPPPAIAGLGMIDDLMVFLAIAGAGVARDYFLRYRAREQETAILQAQLAGARLDVLRAQLNPHFLFNTLNAISALVERDPRGTRRMIARLSDLLRYTLEESTDAEVPLRRELDLLEEYIELMQIRFQGKLAVIMRIADDAREALVPNLILQPLVENAIKHGVGQGGGEVIVAAARAGDNLQLTVSDSGAGPGGGPEGVGLRNTNARLEQLYGPQYHVTLERRAAGGTDAVMLLPFRTAAARP